MEHRAKGEARRRDQEKSRVGAQRNERGRERKHLEAWCLGCFRVVRSLGQLPPSGAIRVFALSFLGLQGNFADSRDRPMDRPS